MKPSIRRRRQRWAMTLDMPGATTLVLSGGRRIAGQASAAFGAGGVTAKWHWDGLRLTVTSSFPSFYPLFYARWGNAFAISDSLFALLACGAPRTLNDAGMAVFIRLGYFVGDDTPFQHIRALPPSPCLTWDGQALRGVPWRHPRGPLGMSRHSAVGAFGECLYEQVRSTVQSSGRPWVLPLSGGRDSRHIFLAMLEAQRPPRYCITMACAAPKADEDAVLAAAVAARAGVPHVLLAPPACRFAAEYRKNQLTHLCTDEHAWALPMVDYLASHGQGQLLDGIAGDVLASGAWLYPQMLHKLDAGDLEGVAASFLPDETYFSRLIAPAYLRRWPRELALDTIALELSRVQRTANPIGQFLFWNRTRREVALIPWGIMAASGLQAAAPFAASNVFDFLAKVPVDYLLQRRFHNDAIARRYPAFNDIAYDQLRLDRPVPLDETAKIGAKLLRYIAARRIPTLNHGYLVPRIICSMLVPGLSNNLLGGFHQALFLLQLDEILHADRPGDKGLTASGIANTGKMPLPRQRCADD